MTTAEQVSTLNIVRYTPEYEAAWNDFVANAKNATFFFDRGYLDYHAERFEDYSLLVLNENNQILAVLPANKVSDRILVSHSGLTFGGFLVSRNEKLINVLLYFKTVLQCLQEKGVSEMHYKEIPSFYNEVPADEVQYALFLLDANLYRRDTAITIRQNQPLPFQQRRVRAIKGAKKIGVEIKEVDSFDEFWTEVLTPNLLKRFGVRPVHALDEICLLHSRFPANIRQFNAYFNGQIMAGTTIFETSQVAHAQYISASDEGRNNGSLDYLFAELIQNVFSEKEYFDFGICNENNGLKLNKGLLEWKEGFGGRSYSHNFYQVQTSNYAKLDQLLENT